MKSQSDLVTPAGQTVHQEFVAKPDGKDYPVVGSSIDAVALTRKGNMRTRVDKKAGKVVMNYEGGASADGKTRGARGRPSFEYGHPSVQPDERVVHGLVLRLLSNEPRAGCEVLDAEHHA